MQHFYGTRRAEEVCSEDPTLALKSTYNKSFEYFLIFQTQDPNLDLLKRIFEILLNKLCLTKEKYCNF